MTKQEHINFWERQIDADYESAEVLFKSGYYAQSLFWAHLTLEKLSKALWIKNNTKHAPPFIHNLLKIISQTKDNFTTDQLEFLADMNTFQIKGRYPDYAESLEKTITKDICKEYLNKTKEMIICIREKLQ